MREALIEYRSAMDWFEAGSADAEFETVHAEMHACGATLRREFGCNLQLQNGQYFITCPVDLAHDRYGFSIAARASRIECSICGLATSECSHIRGRQYDDDVCVHIVMDYEVSEVSVVGRPSVPDARVHSQSVDLAKLSEALGPDFKAGMPVSCDKCLDVCSGIRYPFG